MRKGSRTQQKEKLNYAMVTIKAMVDLVVDFGSETAWQNCPELERRGPMYPLITDFKLYSH